MLAKRCAPELGSDRRPRRCVSPDTTWRFCARRDSICLWSSADVLCTVCRPGGGVCLGGTTGGQEEPHRAEDPNPTPSAQGGVAEALRAPAPCVRSTLPPRPAAFLSLAQASTSGRRGISPRVRVDINGQSACLSKPSGPTGHDRWLWVCLGNAAHVIATIPGPGQRFRPPRVAIGRDQPTVPSAEQQPSSAREPHHP